MAPVAGQNGRAGCPVEECEADDHTAGPDAEEQKERPLDAEVQPGGETGSATQPAATGFGIRVGP
jgi:hypothetical protein